MANEVPTFVQLPQEDLQKLLDEVAVLRQEVLILRQEKEEHHQYLAISDARIHVLEEGQKVTDVSPPNSPHLAHPEQAEPSIELEEVVESAPQPPFKEVRGRYRKRRTSPSTPQVQTVKSGSSREPPSAEAPKKAKHRNPPALQAQPPRPGPSKPVAQQKKPGGKQNSAHHHSRRVKVVVDFQRHASQAHRPETLRGWYPSESWYLR
jgi:hypothetical protein